MNVIFKSLFTYLEIIASILLLGKILVITILHTKKFKAKLSSAFWFYTFFAFNYLIYGVVSLEIPHIEYINPIAVNYVKNLFFTSSLVLLHIFCYKASTNQPGLDFYKGKVKKKQTKQRLALQSVYVISMIASYLQVLMLGLLPFYLLTTRSRVETFSTLCILVCTIGFFLQLVLNDQLKPLNLQWFIFSLFSLLIVPTSSLIDMLGEFVGYLDNGPLYLLLMRGPFLTFRSIQIGILYLNLFRRAEVGVLYD